MDFGMEVCIREGMDEFKRDLQCLGAFRYALG